LYKKSFIDWIFCLGWLHIPLQQNIGHFHGGKILNLAKQLVQNLSAVYLLFYCLDVIQDDQSMALDFVFIVRYSIFQFYLLLHV